MAGAIIREDILQQFPELFGAKNINGREVNVEETLATLTRELRPAIAEALTARRVLWSPRAGAEKYGWPKWDDKFDDPVKGRSGHFGRCARHDRQLPGPRERMALAA